MVALVQVAPKGTWVAGQEAVASRGTADSSRREGYFMVLYGGGRGGWRAVD